MAPNEFTRLARSLTWTSIAVFSSLWLAADHLLCVNSSGLSESYKRFYFRDVQAVQVRRTVTWKVLGLIYGIGVILFAAIAIGPQDAIVAWIFGPIAALFLALFAGNLALGPSCSTTLHTAVQSERLPSLARWNKTMKVLERLRPLIASAQGELPAEELPLRLQQLRGPQPEAIPGQVTYVVDDPNAPPRMVT